MTATEFLQLDFAAVATATLAAVCCALLGNFLVLRRQIVWGAAPAPAALRVIGVGSSRGGPPPPLPMLAGATAAAVVAAVLIELVRRLGRIEPGASMGVVFTVMFAFGVLLLEQSAARAVDLDADCVLYGQLEDILWFAATGWGSLADPAALAQLPRELLTLVALTAACLLLLALFWKELRITTFDPGLAVSLGIPAGLFHYGLMLMVALAAIASFEAVGSILVIAMLICPAATARLLTDRYGTQIVLSVAFGAAAAIAGYVIAGFLPGWFGAPWALNAAGMIATCSGIFLAAAVFLGPRHGLLGRMRRTRDPAAATHPAHGTAAAPPA
ncbi:MAG: metal ABC transporter permease [Alphaproteobacteria bacterium]